MKSTFTFNYTLKTTGRANGRFIVEGNELEFEALNICDPLGDLLKAMVTFIQKPAHLLGEENNAVVEWYCEDCIFVLEISSLDGEYLFFSLTRNSAPFGVEVPPKNIVGSIPLKEFYLTIVLEIDLLIKKKGLLNYHQLWQTNEFPVTYFLTLKKYLINWQIWPPSKEESDVLESEFMMILS